MGMSYIAGVLTEEPANNDAHRAAIRLGINDFQTRFDRGENATAYKQALLEYVKDNVKDPYWKNNFLSWVDSSTEKKVCGYCDTLTWFDGWSCETCGGV